MTLRRNFLKQASGLIAAPVAIPGRAQNAQAETVHEASRKVPVAGSPDVLVCGGGPAGIAAALTAARSGARTLLIERHPFLGGVWTAGALTILIDTYNKSGMTKEILSRLDKDGGMEIWSRFPKFQVYGLEAMKCLLDDMVKEAQLPVQLYTNVVGVARDGNRISGVFTESKSGREYIRAKVVIDTTGDGDVAAAAGCPFEKGRPSDGKMQPMTLYGRIGGYKGGPSYVHPLLEICRKNGWNPSYQSITLFTQPRQPGIAMLMATHLYGDGTDVRDLTQAELRGRWEIRRIVDVLKEHGGDDWKDIFLIDTGPYVGVRETRRILGRYYLMADDLKRGAQFEDAVCDVTFGVDIHAPDPKEEGLPSKDQVPIKPYQIPYRCMLAKGVDNLMMAGRCISGDHIAFASYRVTGDAVAMGEAAGLAAAMAVQLKTQPPDLDTRVLLKRLEAVRARNPA